jgi:Lrp/AsnC family transcriptional regulator, leucine-responsive regulatory protein
MDKTDFKLLRQMELDGRQSFAALGNRVGLSKTPCWRRVQQLESEGVIRGYRAQIDPEKLGLKLYAFVHATIHASKYSEFESAVSRHRSILQCFSTAGEYDYVMNVLVRDITALDTLIRDEIAHLPGVERTVTTVCMKTIKEHALIVNCL